MAAKKIIIDWEKVDLMCKIQCTGEEISSVLDMSYDTLERAVKREKKMACADYIRQKAQGGKASLRRMQWKTADAGSATMQIWLGKNILGQTDSPEDNNQEPSPPLHITFEVKGAESDIKITNAGS